MASNPPDPSALAPPTEGAATGAGTGGGSNDRPISTAGSLGVRSVTAMSNEHVATEVASEVASLMVGNALASRASSAAPGNEGEYRRLQEQLHLAQEQQEELRQEGEEARRVADELSEKLNTALRELEDAKGQLERRTGEVEELQERLAQREEELSSKQDEVERLRASPPAPAAPAAAAGADSAELEALRAQVAALEAEVAAERSAKEELASAHPTIELPGGDSNEEQPLLAAAYQQISVLNTQLAHLYTELTMARTEAQHLRGAAADGFAPGAAGSGAHPAEGQADEQRQSQQIADLVGDIRHLQLDLEYHQQKLDQMLEEKQKLLKELKRSRTELSEAQQVNEEREQLLRHREVDIQRMKEKLESPSIVEAADNGMVSALRTEAAAKDSALIVSHYELHKEKLLRDRLEQKNMKLMERMQKLMMVVETMRKENMSLEKVVQQKDRAHDEKDAQLRQVTQKAKQLQRINKSARGPGGSSVKGSASRSLELDGQGSLPPLTHRSLESEMHSM